MSSDLNHLEAIKAADPNHFSTIEEVNVNAHKSEKTKQNLPIKEISKEVKRYNLALSVDQYNSLLAVANENGESVIDVLRQYIKIGLLLNKLRQSKNAKVLIRENNVDTELLMI